MSCVIRGGGGGGTRKSPLMNWLRKRKRCSAKMVAEEKKEARHALFDWFLDARSPSYMFRIFNFFPVRLFPPIRLIESF